MSPGDLDQILCGLPIIDDPNLIVGTNTCDDAGVYRLNDETALIQTVDFFTPIVDDPFNFGQITAANALSDVYAMGGKPILAMNIVGFPIKTMEKSILKEIIRGGLDKLNEAGVLLVGGHSIEDEELKYGLSVTGTVHPKRILLNSGAKPGDQILLTKPLGTGIISTAIKGGLSGEESEQRITNIMATLNKVACEAMINAMESTGIKISACTDITGFGLIGHLYEVANASGVQIKINSSSLPLIDGALDYAKMGIIPEGAHKNKKFYEQWVDSSCSDFDPLEMVLFDPQTSGGLLISAPQELIEKISELLYGSSYDLPFAIIGEVKEGIPGIKMN